MEYPQGYTRFSFYQSRNFGGYLGGDLGGDLGGNFLPW